MKHLCRVVALQVLIVGLLSSCAAHKTKTESANAPTTEVVMQPDLTEYAGQSTELRETTEQAQATTTQLTPLEEAMDLHESATRAPSNAATDAASLANFAKWSAVTTPASGSTELIGGYASGCIVGARALPLQSPNYIVMQSHKLAYYGDQSLLNYITQLAARAHGAGLPPLMVEDLSHPRGGPVAKGHGSHQTGLDVDISFTLATRNYSDEERETFDSPSYVIGRKVLKPEWGEQQVKLVELGANSDGVNRIFVSPAIKKFFCENFPNAPWLYKIRPWWGHDDHMHVRLNCPRDSKTCRSQSAVDRRTPCGPDLKFWFSKAADQQEKDMDDFWKSGHVKEFPRLPARCESVRTAP